MSAFDTMMANVVAVTSKVFGSNATWVKDSTHTYTALVKYHENAGEDKIGDKKYGLDSCRMEIKNSDFPGLKERIEAQNKESVSINIRGTVRHFKATEADALSDGYCTMITLKKVTSI